MVCTGKRGDVCTQVHASGRVASKMGLFDSTGPVKWQGVQGKGQWVYGLMETEVNLFQDEAAKLESNLLTINKIWFLPVQLELHRQMCKLLIECELCSSEIADCKHREV